MARRGRFTNPNSGGQNLSSLIVSLLRERKNAEEQLLLEKFRNKEVSAEEVQAFYDNWARTSGYTEGTLEFDQLNQRKKNAYDTGIKYRYDALLVDFNDNGGKNYTELMNFLNGDAQTVNDKNNAQQYLDLRKNITNNFINEASNQLQMGQMTIDDFRTQVDAGINSSFAKGSKEYNDAKYSAFVAEYNGEYTKYQNRIKANKSGAYSGFLNFLSQVKSRMASDGVGGELLTRIDADMVSVRAAGVSAGSDAQVKVVGKSESSLAELYAAALSTSGIMGAELTAEDIAAGKTYGIDNIINNPGAIEAWLTMLENGTAEISPEIAAKYGDTPNEIRTAIDKEVGKIAVAAAEANRLNPTETNYRLASQGKALARTIGSQTQIDDVSVGMNQYAEDIYRAGLSEDDAAITIAKTEFQKFLAGDQSIYGKIDRKQLDADLATYGPYGATYKTALSNTERGLKGEPIGMDSQTLEDFHQIPAGYTANGVVKFGQVYSDGSIFESAQNYAGLVNGSKVQLVTKDPNTGLVTKKTVDPLAVGASGTIGNTQIASKSGGYLSVISYIDGINGAKVPVIQSLAALGEIKTGSGTSAQTWGYQYQLSGGEMIYVDTKGNSYNQNPFANQPKLLENGVYFVDGGADAGVTPSKAPTVDIGSFSRTAGNSYVELRKIAEDLNKFITENSASVASLGAVDAATVLKEVATLTSTADKLELAELNTSLFRAGERGASKSDIDLINSRIADLESPGTLQGDNYRRFVLANPDKYRETSPGVFTRLLPKDADFSREGVIGGKNNELDAATGERLPDIIDIRSTATKERTGEGAGKPIIGGPAGLGMGQGFFPTFQDTFFRNTPTAPAKPSYLGLAGYSGGVPTAPKPLAPMAITPAALSPFNAADREERRALISQQSQTTPPPPKPVAPTRIGGR